MEDSGAMENWGLVIYESDYLIMNPMKQVSFDYQQAAETICHELAHQWFGDLVTTASWPDLFLNEGFARYFERITQKLIYPQQQPYLVRFNPDVTSAGCIRHHGFGGTGSADRCLSDRLASVGDRRRHLLR